MIIELGHTGHRQYKTFFSILRDVEIDGSAVIEVTYRCKKIAFIFEGGR